ncbi:MAG: AsmA-like C-terminal region-containing protein, partial [Bryobacteraceae bacterium]
APTGPTAIRALDAGEVKVDYSIPDLVFHGMSDALKNVEAHDVTAVIDASKAPIPTPTPTAAPNQKVSLPAFFPDRLEATNINLTIKKQPQDMVIKNLNLGLYPKKEGKLQIDKVQIPGVHTWTDITATTTYANKNLYLHNLTLDQNNKLEMVNVDASQVGQGKLGLQFKGTLGGGQVASKIDLSTAGKTYQTNTSVHAQDISLGKLGELIGKSPGHFSGDVKSADIDLKGGLDQPATWNGTISTDISNLRQGKISLDQVKLDAEAANGHATVREARIDQANNHVQVRGSIELPQTTTGFGQTPGNFQIAVDAPDLQQLTSFMTQPATGSLQANGNVKTGDGKVQLDLQANGNLIGFQGAAVNHLTANISAAKKMSAPNEKKNAPAPPFYEGVSSSVPADLHAVRYGNYA